MPMFFNSVPDIPYTEIKEYNDLKNSEFNFVGYYDVYNILSKYILKYGDPLLAID